MSRIAGLLVDMDGTLVDTAGANYMAYAEALAAAGVEVSRAAFDQVATGRNWRQFLPALMEGATGHSPAAVAAAKAELYPRMLGHTVLNEALVALIRAGKQHWRTALVTTASAPNVEAVLAHHRLADLFDTIVTGSDVARHKPDPEAYRLAAERLGLSPDRCLVVEDSAIGVASARAFGALCLQVAFPAGPS